MGEKPSSFPRQGDVFKASVPKVEVESSSIASSTPYVIKDLVPVMSADTNKKGKDVTVEEMSGAW